jgi:RNA polymerase sigma-70 factor (ECF subfamily)
MRDVLLLRAAGASAEAVGDQLGMSANAVRVAQYRAAARLRQLIESCEEHREFFDSTTFHSGPAA